MSTTVDERVVKMEFDNKEFEKNIKQSQDSLKKFSEGLKFDGSKFEEGIGKSRKALAAFGTDLAKTMAGNAATSFFGNLGASAGVMAFSKSLDSVSSGIQNIELRFSALGVIGKRVLENLTDSCLSLLNKGINVLFGGITQGGLSRAMNIEKAKFQLEGLGITWKNVFEDINYGVQDTAYGLDAAALAASQLATAGVKYGGEYGEEAQDISEMGQALRAISGVAAMTGRDYENISNIFTTIASQQRVMGDQLTQLSYAGISAAEELAKFFNGVNEGSTEATETTTKNIKAITKGLKVDATAIRDLTSKGAINFAMFSEAMDSAFGQHAKDANKTVTGELSNIRAAMSKIGANFFQPIIENEGPLVNMLETVRQKINELRDNTTDMAKGLSTVVNSLIKGVSVIAEGIQVDFFDGFSFNRIIDEAQFLVKAFIQIQKVVELAKESFKNVFPEAHLGYIHVLIYNFFELIGAFKISSETMDKLSRIFTGFFSLIKMGINTISSLLTFLSPFKTTLHNIGQTLLSVAATIGDVLTDLSNSYTMQEVADSFVNNMGAIGKALAFFSGIMHKAIAITKSFIAMFFPKKQPTSGMAKSIDDTSKSAQKALNPIQQFLEIIKKKFPFLETAKKLILDLKAAFDKFMNSKTGQAGTIGGSMIASVLLGIQLIKNSIADLPKQLIPDKIMKAIDKLPKQFQQITNNINKVLNSASNALNAFTRSLQLDSLMKAAKAIAILTGSLFVLSMINVDRMAPALAALGAMFLMLNKSLDWLQINILDESLVKLNVISGVMIKFAASIVVLGLALKVVSTIPWDKMLIGFGGLTLMMVAFVAVIEQLSKIQAKTAASSLSIIALANSMFTLSLALKILSTIKWNDLLIGMSSVVLMMLAMSESLAALSAMGASGITAAIAITAMASSMMVLVLALKLLSTIKWNELLVGFGTTVLMLVAVTESLTILSALGPGVLVGALAFTMLTAALIGISFAFKMIANVPWSNLLVGFGGLIISLIAFTALTDRLEKMGPKVLLGTLAINALTVAVLGLAASIKLISGDAGGAIGGAFAISMLLTTLVGAMYLLKEMDLADIGAAMTMLMLFTGMVTQLAATMIKISEISDNVGVSTFSIIALIVAMVVALKALNGMKFDAVKMLKISASITAFGIALKMVASAFKIMSQVPWASFIISLGVLIASFALLVHFSGPLAAIGPVLYEIAGALAIFSLACVGIGAAMMLFTSAISLLASMSGTAAIALVGFIRVIATVAGDIATLAMDIFMAFINAFADYFDQLMEVGNKIATTIINSLKVLLPQFIELGKIIINSILDGLRSVAPNAIETFNVIFEYFMKSMAAHAQPITEAACDFMINFMNGLKSKIPELAETANELMITFMNAIATVIQTNTEPITNAMMAVIQALLGVLLTALPAVLDIGTDLIGSLISGIMTMISSVFETGTEIIGELLEAIGVPEDFVEAGKNLILGFIDGLGQFTDKIVEKAKEIGHTAIQALKDTLKINSPSKEGEEVGHGIPEGVALGEEKGAGLVEKASSWLGSLVPKNLKDGVKQGLPGVETALSGITDATGDMADKVGEDADRAKGFLATIQQSLAYSKYADTVKSEAGSSSVRARELQEMNNALKLQGKGLKENKKAADDASKSMDNYAKKTGGGGGGAAKATDEMTSSLDKAIKAFKSFEDLQKSLQEKIESSIDIFSEFDKKTELTGDKLLENMRSQVSGVKEWANNLKTLASRGIEKGLLQKLSELGPQGFEKVNAFVQMSDEQLKEANGLYAESLMLPDSVSADIVGSFANAGMWASEGFAGAVDTNAGYQPGQLMGQSLLKGTMEALDEHSPSKATAELAENANIGFVDELGRAYWIGRVKLNAMKLGEAVVEGIAKTLGSADMAQSSRKAIASFVKGIAEAKGVVKTTKTVCQTFINTLKDNLPDKTFTDIVNNIFLVVSEAIKKDSKTLSEELLKQTETLKKKLSESFIEIGEYASEGLAKGIEKKIKKIAEASVKVSKEAVKQARKTFEEKSPSRVMAGIGEYATIGLAQGMVSKISYLTSSVDDVSSVAISRFQNALSKVQDTMSSTDDNFTITPVLDLSQVENGVSNIESMFNSRVFGLTTAVNARYASGSFDRRVSDAVKDPQPTQITNNYEFNQTNNSPKALTNAEIYRQTKNLFSTVKGATR